MAKASVQSVKSIVLTLTEDEAHAVLALTGACNGGDATSPVYDALTAALTDEGDYYFQSNYSVGSRDGSYLGALYLHPNPSK